MRPSENHRSLIYSTIIQGTRPMTRADYVCEDCERDYFACECFGLSNNTGSGVPSLTSGPVSDAEAAE